MARQRPLIVLMHDEDPGAFTHTIKNPVCNDPTCCCADMEYLTSLEEGEAKRREQARKRNKRIIVSANYEPPRGALNGNQGFSILR
jgi:hypothetical protein